MSEKRDTITAIVIHFLRVKLKETGLHRFEEVLAQALWGLSEIQLDTGGRQEVTKILTMNAMKAVDMPVGYIDWTSVGLIVGGKIQLITKADSFISLYEKPYKTDINAVPKELAFSQQLNNCEKFFVEDWNNKQIKFTSAVPTGKVYLGYFTDGFNPDAETVVHPYVKDYILKYLVHEMLPSSASGPELYSAEMKVRARNSGLDEESVLQIFRDTNPFMYGGF